MLRQILCGFILLAFVNFLIGCTSIDTVPPQEVQRDGQKVIELVLLDGGLIQFGENGAGLRPMEGRIVGTTADGSPMSVPLGDLQECRITPPRSVSVEKVGNTPIREVVFRSGRLVRFQDPGARYDSTTQRIRGKTTGGDPVTYAAGTLLSIRTERPEAIPAAELNFRPSQSVYEAIDHQNVVITFGPAGGRIEGQPAAFYGFDRQGHAVEIPADSVLYARVQKSDAVKTIFAALGITVLVGAAVVGIVMATKQSCPFIYSFDGEQYFFDAEPLGGAICPGLARTDISRLESIRAVDGEYRLLIRNQVPETQFLDRMKLLVVDHPGNVSVYPDIQGNFYGFRNILGATSASDENGMSLMNFLRASDNIAWQTNLPAASRTPDAPVRHELTVTLPKPAGAKKAWLVTNIGTSLWGSNMIRKTVEYRGNSAADWLKSLTPGSPSYMEMYQFINGEEMYNLGVWVKERDSWKQQAMIQGQGPLINEDRVYPMNVSNAAGDSLVLRFNPPKGFWTFDYIGVSYEDPTVTRAVRVDAHSAQDEEGHSILGSLDSVDHGFYVMPEVGDQAWMSFRVPEQAEGTVRSVFLETNGYYELHLQKDLPDQMARLYYIGTHPGQIVKTAMEEFRNWQAEQKATASRSH